MVYKKRGHFQPSLARALRGDCNITGGREDFCGSKFGARNCSFLQWKSGSFLRTVFVVVKTYKWIPQEEAGCSRYMRLVVGSFGRRVVFSVFHRVLCSMSERAFRVPPRGPCSFYLGTPPERAFAAAKRGTLLDARETRREVQNAVMRHHRTRQEREVF